VAHDLLELLVATDRDAARASADLRWAPLTPLLVLASAWWVKGLLFALAGLAWDLRRRALPRTALAALAAMSLASLLTSAVKDAVGRVRPPLEDATIQAIGALPTTPSFPSGHASTAFAAAVALGLLAPRLRVPALALATLVAVSRVYLGVHFWLDVLAGAALGALVGLLVAAAARRLASAPAPRTGTAATTPAPAPAR